MKNGQEKGYHENGTLHYKCEWINAQQHGIIISYNEDGKKIKESYLKYGKYVGHQKEWWPNGKLRAFRIMKNGEIYVEKIFDESGNKVFKS